jgi:hypothetical protein
MPLPMNHGLERRRFVGLRRGKPAMRGYPETKTRKTANSIRLQYQIWPGRFPLLRDFHLLACRLINCFLAAGQSAVAQFNRGSHEHLCGRARKERDRNPGLKTADIWGNVGAGC